MRQPALAVISIALLGFAACDSKNDGGAGPDGGRDTTSGPDRAGGDTTPSAETGGTGGSGAPGDAGVTGDLGVGTDGGLEAGGGDGAGGDTVAAPAGLGPWTGNDNVPPSKSPPGGLRPDQVPLFVSLGFDDNPEPEPMSWVLAMLAARKNPAGKGRAATHDGAVARATFYNTSVWNGGAPSWKLAHGAGHETGNHTVNHLHGGPGQGGMNFTAAQWRTEIEGCTNYLIGAAVGVPREQIVGFRTPFGNYNAALFPVLKELGFRYDCSIDEGLQPDQDGSNYFWPYTLDGGSPGHDAHDYLAPIASWPKGLWEMPIYQLIGPPDSEAARYGAAPGLRTKIGQGGKITGMDWNLWLGVGLTPAEFLATLKYSFDQRRKGNRAPFLLGMHSKIYATAGWEKPTRATPAEARAVIEQFLDYVLTFPEVRVVPTSAVLDWVRNPVPLD